MNRDDTVAATNLPTRSLRTALLGAALVAGLLPGQAAAATRAAPLTDGGRSAAAPTSSTVKLVKVADVAEPVLAIGARDGTGRLFIVAKAGRIRILKSGTLLAKPFLDISGSVSGTAASRGSWGSRSTPRSRPTASSTSTTSNRSGDTVVREYRASATNPNVVATGSGRTIITIDQPYANHNGGMLAFGRDGYLYIGMGDGGSGGDPGNRAQNVNSLLGKMLRINVNGRTATRNYRNPSSNPYVGKPGRERDLAARPAQPVALLVRPLERQPVDRRRGPEHVRGGRPGGPHELRARQGRQLGLAGHGGQPLLPAGDRLQPDRQEAAAGRVQPRAERPVFGHRRLRLPGVAPSRPCAGWYVYGDYCSGEVWAVASGASRPATPVRLLGAGSGRLISAFGEDNAGELYLCDMAAGAVYRIVAG